MTQLHNEDPSAPVSFVLVGDPSNPDGGFLERFVGGSIPSFGVTASGATPSDFFPTDIITNEYDGFADFPRYPIDILSDLNAYLGIIFEHTAYLNQDLSGLAIDLGTYGDTTYYMNPTEELPLLDILRFIPGGNPLADLLQPDLSVLVNLGYGSITEGYDTGNEPDVPTPFGLFPADINPTELFQRPRSGHPGGHRQGSRRHPGRPVHRLLVAADVGGRGAHVRPHPERHAEPRRDAGRGGHLLQRRRSHRPDRLFVAHQHRRRFDPRRLR